MTIDCWLGLNIADFRVADDVEEPNVWEDNWDDDNVEDDFSQQLKAHLESKKMETWFALATVRT